MLIVSAAGRAAGSTLWFGLAFPVLNTKWPSFCFFVDLLNILKKDGLFLHQQINALILLQDLWMKLHSFSESADMRTSVTNELLGFLKNGLTGTKKNPQLIHSGVER